MEYDSESLINFIDELYTDRALTELCVDYLPGALNVVVPPAVTTQAITTATIVKTEPEHLPTALLSEPSIDFVLVTALAEERDAVLDKLPGYRKLPPANDDIRTYFQAELPVTFPDGSTGFYNIVVMPLLGMGRVQAVTATADAIHRWHPRYVLLVGIAGGLAAGNVAIGDLLISDQVVDYECQKLTSQGPQIRWNVYRADPRLLNACNNLLGDSWVGEIQNARPGLGKPQRHTGPIASGDKVVAFGEVLAKYHDMWPKLIGVEMEASGVATAVFESSETPGFFMVRGVSDLADENKGSPNVEKWRLYACDAAASFVVALLKNGPIPLQKKIVSISFNAQVRREPKQSPPATKRHKIQLLLEHSEQHGALEILLGALARTHPTEYSKSFSPVRHRTESPFDLSGSIRDLKQIFLSHATQDTDFAHRLAADLANSGWHIWIAPDSIRPGEKWVEAISRGLEESGVVVLVLSPSAVRSPWVKSETNVAIDLEHKGRLRLIPVELESTDAPVLWNAYQRIPFANSYQDGLKSLLREL